MKYTGSCHCGGIKFEVEGDFQEGLECNCSMCSRKGSLLGFAPRENLKLLTPETDAAWRLYAQALLASNEFVFID